MGTTIPPAHRKIAAPLDWETATLEDLLDLSDATGLPACALLRAMQKVPGSDPQHISER